MVATQSVGALLDTLVKPLMIQLLLLHVQNVLMLPLLTLQVLKHAKHVATTRYASPTMVL